MCQHLFVKKAEKNDAISRWQPIGCPPPVFDGFPLTIEGKNGYFEGSFCGNFIEKSFLQMAK
jgi:hypothetical protein